MDKSFGPIFIYWTPPGRFRWNPRSWWFGPGGDWGDFVIWIVRLYIAIDVPYLRRKAMERAGDG